MEYREGLKRMAISLTEMTMLQGGRGVFILDIELWLEYSVKIPNGQKEV